MAHGEGRLENGENAEEREGYLEKILRDSGITNPEHGVPPSTVADQLGIHTDPPEADKDAGESGDR